MISKSPPATCTRYHVDGNRALRCGAVASIGLPLAVIVPSTTQLFDPIASVRALPARSAATVASPEDRARANASLHEPGGPGGPGGPGRLGGWGRARGERSAV